MQASAMAPSGLLGGWKLSGKEVHGACNPSALSAGRRHQCQAFTAHQPIAVAAGRTRPRSAPVAAAVLAAAMPAASAAAAAAATSGTATLQLLGGLTSDAVFSGVSAAIVPVYALLAFFPRARLTRAWLVHSQAPFLLLGALYTLLFIQACQAGLFSQLAPFWHALTAQPLTHGSLFTSSTIDVAAVGHILGQPLFTLLAWVQLLMLDLLQARSVLVDGLIQGVPTAHSVLLCFFVGPIGLLSHALTRALMPGQRHKLQTKH